MALGIVAWAQVATAGSGNYVDGGAGYLPWIQAAAGLLTALSAAEVLGFHHDAGTRKVLGAVALFSMLALIFATALGCALLDRRSRRST